MLGDDHLDNFRELLDFTQQKTAAGISFIRVHVVDEERCERDLDCRNYLGWTREHACQVQLRFGGEQIHWIPKSLFDEAGLALPDDDISLYDGKRLITTQYNDTGQFLTRTFYELAEDQAEIDHARNLVARVTEIIAGNNYRLQPATEPVVAID